ncbi:hypothetical protein ACP4OV_015800 [Aristida adscensionis]
MRQGVYPDTTIFPHDELIGLTFVSMDEGVDEDGWSCMILSGNSQRSNILFWAMMMPLKRQ